MAEARAKLIQSQALMMRCGMAGALEQVRQLLQALPPAATLLQPGQQRVMLARRGVPRGRPLRPDELVEVIWNLEEPAQREVGHPANKAATRQEILLRLWPRMPSRPSATWPRRWASHRALSIATSLPCALQERHW